MLIGLHGRAQAGKDTAANFIESWAMEQKKPFSRKSFAEPLKVSAARALGFEGEPFECVEFCNDLKFAARVKIEWDNDALAKSVSPTTSWEGWEISGREYLQLFGTEAHRDVFGMNFWVDVCLPDGNYDGPEIAVVTDVRFPNEAERIHDLGGEVWQVVRPSLGEASDAHASEVPLPYEQVDHVIINDRDLDHFADLVKSLMERKVYA